MPSSAPASPPPSSPASSAILSPSSKLTLSSDLSAATPRHIYKLSSQYFLTKHFPEANAAIRPLLRTSDRKWQQKAWALYLVILDNGLKLSHEDGRKVWGRQAWETEVSRVKSGKVWDELLDSVDGVISSIDADVVMAMIQLSLHHGNTKVAQLKVEEWLAVASPPSPHQADVNDVKDGDLNHVTKPKDYYDKVLESYCLFLLPRNEEWDFAITFIGENEYLSELRKKIYLTKLADLKAAHSKEKANSMTFQHPQASIPTSSSPRIRSPSTRSSSQDLIDLPPSPTHTSLPNSDSSSAPAPSQRTLSTLANRLLRNPSRYLRQFLSLLRELSQDDSFLRTLLFALALAFALLRKDVRTRVRMAVVWMGRKVRETIVMGM